MQCRLQTNSAMKTNSTTQPAFSQCIFWHSTHSLIEQTSSMENKVLDTEMQPASLIKIKVYTISAGHCEGLSSLETILDALLQGYVQAKSWGLLYFYRFLAISGKGLEIYC